MRLLRVWAHLCLLTLLFSLVTVPPASADQSAAVGSHVISATDSSAPSRTIRAYDGQTRTLFRVKFRTERKNEKRRVTARVRVAVPKRASDPFLVATYYLYCAKAGTNGGKDKILGSQNIYAGTRYTHNPHYVYTAAKPGRHECWLRLSGGRPRASEKRPSSNVLRIGGGSYLRLTEAVYRTSRQAFRPGKPSKRVQWRRSADVVATRVTVPLLTGRIQIGGVAWLTSCTAKEGSLDPVTGKHLCEGRIDRRGSTVLSKVVVTQPSLVGGRDCAVTHLPNKAGRKTRITADVHHKMVSYTGVARISNDVFCSRRIHVKIYVKHVKGAAVVIHNQGTSATAILPKAWTL